MAVDPALQDSLNRSLTASGDLAKVRRAGKAKPGSESALNLLDSIIDDTVVEAEQERRRRKEDEARAEERAREAKEREEEAARQEAEQAILAEQQAQEELKQHQAELQAQLQREKDIEAGIIDLEEEARLAREEEERKAAEAAEIKRKTEAKLQAIEFRKNTESELLSLRNEQMAKAAIQKKSKLPAIIGAVAAVLLIGGGVAGYMISQQKDVPPNYPYDLHEDNGFYEMVFIQEESGSDQIALNTVKQAEDPKPVKHTGGGKKSSGAAAAPAPGPAKPKPSLTGGGKGGLFGGGKRGL